MQWFGKFNTIPKISKLLQSPLVREFAKTAIDPESIRAIFVPHAGIEYSGVCASIAYHTIINKSINNIILLCTDHAMSPNHKLLNQKSFELSNFGTFRINQNLIEQLLKFSQFETNNSLFNQEHSFFIQLPFIRQLNFEFIVPIICGSSDPKAFEAILSILKPNDLLVCSSDLSHINGNFVHKMDANGLVDHDSDSIRHIFGQSTLPKNHSICGEPVVQFLHYLCKTYSKLFVPRVMCYYNSQLKKNVLESTPQSLIDTIYSNNFASNESTVSYASMIFSNMSYASNNLRNIVTPFEKHSLLKYASGAILKKQPKLLACPVFFTVVDMFVTVYSSQDKNKMFGCIGQLKSKKYVFENVKELAHSAAYEDFRFEKLSQNFSIDITFLSPLKPITLEQYWDDSFYVKGLHGIFLKLHNKEAYFLPTVLVEQISNKKEQLKYLCNKAEFNDDCYQDAVLFYNVGFTISSQQ